MAVSVGSIVEFTILAIYFRISMHAGPLALPNLAVCKSPVLALLPYLASLWKSPASY
jgi:hypothetical protein